MTVEESVGLNTPGEAILLTQYLGMAKAERA
jgi:hypothetical protein